MLRNAIETLRLRRLPDSFSGRTAVRVAVAAGVLLLALLLLRTLSQTHLPRTATNDVPAVTPIGLAPGASHCQAGESVPGGSGSVTFPARATGPGAARVRVSAAGATGAIPLTTAYGYVFMKLDAPVRGGASYARVCFRNEGAVPITLFGAPAPGAAVPPPPGSVRVRLDWFRPAAQRNWSLGPTIARRFPLYKAPFLGPWAFWLAALLALALSAAAIAWVARAERP